MKEHRTEEEKKTDGEEINLKMWLYYLQWVGTCLER